MEKTENSVLPSPASYWEISRPKITRENGTDWPWNCFMPWETNKADLSIDMKRHHVPNNFTDKFTYTLVKLLRIPTDMYFQRRYPCRAMMLETVAAVPTKQRLDQSFTRRSRERKDAFDDHVGACETQVVREATCYDRTWSFL